MILLVGAVAEELRGVPARVGIDVLITGIGPVEAALQTARTLARTAYTGVLCAGIAGVFRGRGEVGDAFLVAQETYVELQLDPDEPEGNERFPLHRKASSDRTLLAKLAGRRGLRVGTGITLARMTTSDAVADALSQRYAVDVESMEGFAVLRAAELAGIPALEVRGISNFVGARATSEWSIARGIAAVERALDIVLPALL